MMIICSNSFWSLSEGGVFRERFALVTNTHIDIDFYRILKSYFSLFNYIEAYFLHGPAQSILIGLDISLDFCTSRRGFSLFLRVFL